MQIFLGSFEHLVSRALVMTVFGEVNDFLSHLKMQ